VEKEIKEHPRAFHMLAYLLNQKCNPILSSTELFDQNYLSSTEIMWVNTFMMSTSGDG
jgi:hypothetical protein